MRLHAATQINAPPEKVWEVITDFKSYNLWNPFITNVVGEPKKGEKLTVEIHSPDAKVFEPKLITVNKNQTLRWVGRLWGVPYLLTGVHSFMLQPVGKSKTLFVHEEDFRGILVPFLKKRLKESQAGFEEMNEALKKQVESK